MSAAEPLVRATRMASAIADLPSITGSAVNPEIFVGDETNGFRLFRWRGDSARATNDSGETPRVVAAPADAATGRWIEAPITGAVSGLTGSLTNVTVDGAGLLLAPDFDPEAYELVEPVDYQSYQHTNGTAEITVTVRAAGPTGTEVEARFDGGAWETIGETDFTGTATGTMTLDVGQGNFQVRVVGGSTILTSSYVTVGLGIAIWGQSNGSGRLENNQTATNTTFVATMFGNDGEWKAMTDPTDSATGSLYSGADDSDSEMGSVWPMVAERYANATSVPLFIVQCTKGGSSFSSSPGWTSTGALTTNAIARMQATGTRYAAWWQGEGGFDDATGDGYVTPFKAMSAALVAAIPGAKVIPCKLQEVVGVTTPRLTNGWYAIGRIWDEDANALQGPTLADVPVGHADNILTEDEGTGSPYYHLKSDATGAEAARRWATNLVAHFPTP